MDARFDDIFDSPENKIFNVVFYPDRIYHARYLNATRSSRYRYNVREVRTKLDITAMKGEVYLDGSFLTNFLRIEYRGGRLVELAREKGRFVKGSVLAWIRILSGNGQSGPEAVVKLHHCRWIDAYQVELWETLDPPPNTRHDFRVIDLLGADGNISRVEAFTPALRDIGSLRRLEIAFRENDRDLPFGYPISDSDAAWDNNYLRSHQEPRTDEPSADQNTVSDLNYFIDFQRGFYLDANQVPSVRYRNALMNPGDPESFDDNVIEMRWILQRELGGSLVFFHEVIVPPGRVEGTHRHIGTEELYYVTEGQGIAYMGESDDPSLAHLPVVERRLFGLESRRCRELPVQPGAVIFSKSGGIHGIRNAGDVPLKFVAFLYHTR